MGLCTEKKEKFTENAVMWKSSASSKYYKKCTCKTCFWQTLTADYQVFSITWWIHCPTCLSTNAFI